MKVIIQIGDEQAIVNVEVYMEMLTLHRKHINTQIELLMKSCLNGETFLLDTFIVNFKALELLVKERKRIDEEIQSLKKKEDGVE